MKPWIQKSNENLWKQAVEEVKTISLFFPDVRAEQVRVCMAAWLGVLCTVDDLLEVMVPNEAENAIQESISILQGNDKDNERGGLKKKLGFGGQIGLQ